MTPIRHLALAAALLSVTACASKVTAPQEYSGYLGSYDNLQEVKSPSGAPVLRWTDPQFDASRYRAIYLKPTVLYPQPEPNDKVSTQTLASIARRCDQAAARELAKAKPLAKQPGPGVLVIAPAITAVTASTEGLKPYEVLPITLVAAGVTAAAGTRDEDSHLYMEFLVTDGATGKPVGKAVRKMQGVELENRQEQVKDNTFNSAIDQTASDARALFQ